MKNSVLPWAKTVKLIQYLLSIILLDYGIYNLVMTWSAVSATSMHLCHFSAILPRILQSHCIYKAY